MLNLGFFLRYFVNRAPDHYLARPACLWHAIHVNLVWSDKVFLSLVSGSLGRAYHESDG